MARYLPGPAIDLREELDRLAGHLGEPEAGGFAYTVLYAAPARPYAGLTVYADGTTWDPGSGEGIYRYSLGAAWVLVG